jgi:predicted adenylyl cyclase CyaB
MPHINIEIKARCSDHNPVREFLHGERAEFRGKDHQVDTYFCVPHGRLKLREGDIENNLIFYQRPDGEAPKQSDVTLYTSADATTLKQALAGALGVSIVVDKRREIYFINNVKFHLDTVKGLGSFLEIEAIDIDGSIGIEKLREQCRTYMAKLGVRDEDLIAGSYSEMEIKN